MPLGDCLLKGLFGADNVAGPHREESGRVIDEADVCVSKLYQLFHTCMQGVIEIQINKIEASIVPTMPDHRKCIMLLFEHRHT